MFHSTFRSDLSLRIDTSFGDPRSGLPSGVGIFNILNEPPHRIDALLYGTLSKYGCGFDYKHTDGHGFTILMHTMNTSNSLDLNGKINLLSSTSSDTQINFETFCNINKYIQDDTYLKYGTSIELIRVLQHGLSIGIQHDTYTDDTIVDFTMKRNLFTTKDTGTSIEISIKATKTFNFVNYYLTRPLNLIFELTFSRDVK